MLISLDYDGTYTEDPDFWLDFIDRAQLRDHEVITVTFRGDDTPIEDERLLKKIRVIYTAAHAKRAWCESLGYKVDVWIDDNPDLIDSTTNTWTDEEREKWKDQYWENQKEVEDKPLLIVSNDTSEGIINIPPKSGHHRHR